MTEQSDQAPQTFDATRRRLAKGLFAAPVLMTIPGRQVFAGGCTLSGSLSGNVSNATEDCANHQAYGRSPGYWKNLDKPCLLDRTSARFSDHFSSSKFGDLSIYEIIMISEGHKDYCGSTSSSGYSSSHDGDGKKGGKKSSYGKYGYGKKKSKGKKSYDGGSKKYQNDDDDKDYSNYCDYPQPERELARFAVAAYLNAYDAEFGGGTVDPGYFFTRQQVIGLYLAAENGGGIYPVNGVDYYFSREAVVNLFEESWI